jgi:hypothetical protein
LDPEITGPLLTSVHYLLEFDSGSEFSDSPGSDLDGGARLRVSAIAGLVLRDGKRAEPDQGNPFAFSKGSGNAVHGGVYCGCRLRLRYAAGSGDPINQISFVHGFSPDTRHCGSRTSAGEKAQGASTGDANSRAC